MELFIILFASVILNCGYVIADNSIMPDELVNVADKYECKQVENFFSRPGMIDPPYVYGFLTGETEDSAAFWCEQNKQKGNYILLFYNKMKNSNLCKCGEVIIEWRNFPGGLSIVKDYELSLDKFSYIDNREKKGPKGKKANGPIIMNSYDGVIEYFFAMKVNG